MIDAITAPSNVCPVVFGKSVWRSCQAILEWLQAEQNVCCFLLISISRRKTAVERGQKNYRESTEKYGKDKKSLEDTKMEDT